LDAWLTLPSLRAPPARVLHSQRFAARLIVSMPTQTMERRPCDWNSKPSTKPAEQRYGMVTGMTQGVVGAHKAADMVAEPSAGR